MTLSAVIIYKSPPSRVVKGNVERINGIALVMAVPWTEKLVLYSQCPTNFELDANIADIRLNHSHP